MSDGRPSSTNLDEYQGTTKDSVVTTEPQKTDAIKITESNVVSPSPRNADDVTENSENDNAGGMPDIRHVRRIIAEDPGYNLATVSELEEKALLKIIENFAFNANMYTKLKPVHKKRVLENLKLDIPLKVVTDLIEDGVYWKRKCMDRWILCDVSHYGGSWKRIFLERNIEEIIENFVPEKSDRTCLEDTLALSTPYVQRLIITQMLPPIKVDVKVTIKDDGSDAESEIEEMPQIDHLNLHPIVSKLSYLTDLRLSYDVKNCGMNFEWNIFQFTVNDCLQLAKCVASATQLKVFHLTRSRVDCDRCRVIISNLLDHPNLIELDFSHNHIADRGARALGKMINNRSQLQKLNISNNMIKVTGAQAIGYALLKNVNLEVLNMRLNRILDEGGQAICKSLLTNSTLRDINLAANEMTEPTAAILSQVLQTNTTLTSVDVSNNKLGPDGGKQIQEGMASNRTILNMDMRFTDCGDEAIFSISQIINYNQKVQMYNNEDDQEIKLASSYILSDLHRGIFGENSVGEKSRSLSSTVESSHSIKASNIFKVLHDEHTLSVI